jgi:NDP-sugar pyrophosphorylase family protein
MLNDVVAEAFNIQHSTSNIEHSASPVIAILAGGFGTRLGALTGDLPKPMIAIGGRPYLERVIESFARCELRNIVLLTGHRAETVEAHFGDGAQFGVRIAYSRETEPLGTGGAIREARPLLGERFVVAYGDVLRYFDYDRFVNVHDEPCLAVYPRQNVGNADIDGDRIILFDKRAPELPYIDAGFSLMPSSVIDLLPHHGACSFEETVFPVLAAERRLACEVVNLDFYDIGTPDELARTRATLEGSGQRPAASGQDIQ